MSIRENVKSILHSRGMYVQPYDSNNTLLKYFEIDLKFKFYTCFDRVGLNEGYGHARILYLPFILYVGNNLVTFEYVDDPY